MLRVYIDMDNTFCDILSAVEIWRDWALTDEEKMWPWSMTGLFKYLKPMPGAIEFYRKYENICELWFLTRPSIKNLHCYTEKAEWIKRYFGEEGLERLILTPQKDLLIGDILIDDASNYGQVTFQGEWWQFGTKDNKDWEEISQKLDIRILRHITDEEKSK